MLETNWTWRSRSATKPRQTISAWLVQFISLYVAFLAQLVSAALHDQRVDLVEGPGPLMFMCNVHKTEVLFDLLFINDTYGVFITT